MTNDHKTVFVSGGSRGIGKAICLKFAEHGFKVYFSYKSNKDAAHELVSTIKDKFSCPEAVAFQCDMSNVQEVKSLFKENKDEFTAIDVLVNNTGGHGKTAPFLFCSNEYFWEIMELNLKSVVNSVREILPIFIKKKEGRIVNITSISGLKGNPGHAPYAAAKAAVNAFSKSVLKEIGSMGIIINSVAPGFIETESVQNIPEKYYKLRIENSIYKRMGYADEVANVVFYLGSTAPEYMTGQELIIDGGISG
ncbi:3-oxoacyl-ACP reductase [Galbibacter marinus]|uniref:3-oxoacyl-ACP reductase n=1 Tax=Galbibacter marinus TaxID=555500 RepID=K2Q2X1_9FLAO|nr:SDR family oxidoreductase [Galbibacter marinus]EKF55176.1 3-oxoacyl-ACP reductase [Galbibacter marinus]